MRDMLLLTVVAAMFVFGYFVMDKLDHFLERLRPEEDLSADEAEHEIPDAAEVEDPCFQCYNTGCTDRVRHPMTASGEKERTA